MRTRSSRHRETAGRSSGSALWRNRCAADAPTSAAASSRLGGMVCSPPSRGTMNKPTIWHTAALGVAGVAALRAHRGQYEQVQIGLEQVLDRLERGEIRPEHALPGSPVNAFVRLADEIRSFMSPGAPPRG